MRKIVFFDMDGVLFSPSNPGAPSSWALIAEAAGCAAENDALRERWNNDELDHYIHWMEETVKLYQNAGLRQEVFERALSSIPLMTGAKETVAELKRRGLQTALVTGGFQFLAKRARLELGIDHIMAACELIWDKQGRLMDAMYTPYDFRGKLRYFETLLETLRLTPQEAVMVGDGKNDIHIAEEAGLSIAFNGHPELKKVCTYAVEGKDLREILPLIK